MRQACRPVRASELGDAPTDELSERFRQLENTRTREGVCSEIAVMTSTTGMKVDTSDPNVRRLVYNMYRGMLGTYNDKANTIIGALPKEMVCKDQGITRQLESMIRQSSQLSGGESTPSPGPPTAPASGDGVTTNSTAPSFPPAPPPPPPPAPGQLPAVRLSTEIPESRGLREPPAAIQNAMMTKDKKPFTYTPGGLDLSQIRSPRMARRITRNANAEGVTGENVQISGPKTSPLAQAPPPGSLPPSAVAAMQPQMAVPVFPTGGGMPQLHHVNAPPGSHYNASNEAPPPPPPPPSQQLPPPPPPQPVSNSFPKNPAPVIRPVQVEPPKPASIPSPTVTKSQPTVIQYSPPPPPPTPHNEPGSIYVPPVTTTRAQVGSIYIPPINNNVQQESISASARQPPTPQTASPMSPIQLNKAPTPWMSQHQRQQQQPALPPWANREESQQQRPLPPQHQQQQQQQQQQLQQQQQQQPGIRIIPIQVEGRNEPVTPPKPPQPIQSPTNQPHTRIIPIQIEGASTNGMTQQQQQQQQQRRPVYVHSKFNPPQSPQTPAMPSPAPFIDSHSSEQNARQLQQQHSWGPTGGNGGPIQSRSFRVLQKITDTDNTEGQSDQEHGPSSGQWNSQGQGVPVQQLRKLQLNDDDRALMNRFKAQVSEEAGLNEEENPRYRGGHIPSRVFRMLDESVDEDSFLHNESDPRYRGPVIPSRAFRMLQNMTDGTSEGFEQQVPRGPAVARGPQERPSQMTPTGEAVPQPYVPPSEQQVQEPRKYTGGAIPSRSFRMLQAMTAPENCAPILSSDGRENPTPISHQGYDDWSNYDPGYWGPEAWWAYYPSPPVEMSENGEQHYWDPYSMYAYMAEVNAAYGYPPMPYPYHIPPPRPPMRYQQGGSSDSEECSGYSSTDEMAYYGAQFARGMIPMMPECQRPLYSVPPTPVVPNIAPTPVPHSEQMDENKSQHSTEKPEQGKSNDEEANISRQPSSVDLDAYETAESNKASDEDETSSDSDTEVEEEENSSKRKGSSSSSGHLQAIRSVSDINVYKDVSGSDVPDSETNEDETEHEEESYEDEDDEDDDDDEEEEEEEDGKVYHENSDCIPHQLSVIYEESEQSDAESVRRHAYSAKSAATKTSSSLTVSDDGDSSTTLDNGEEESDGDYDAMDNESSTVTVRLPLKLKFSRSENDEEVTTVIVGDSQVKKQDDVDVTDVSDASSSPVVEKLEVEEVKETRDSQKTKCESICDDNTDVSVTLCFTSKSNQAKRVEQWRKDSSKFIRDSTSATKPTKAGSKSIPNSENKQSCDTPQPSEEGDSYETAESDSDVSVCLSLPLKKRTQRGSGSSTPGFENISSISEEDDEEDGKASSHCEDDSSSTTSIQTVRMATVSQSQSSGTDEAEDLQTNKQDVTKPLKLNNENVLKEESEESESEEDDSDDSSDSSCVSSKEVVEKTLKGSEIKASNKSNEEQDLIQKIYDMCTESDKNMKDDNKVKRKQDAAAGKREKEDESEEDDSGVTSDMSRQISDADTESEAGKNEVIHLTQCQRASTHSRLFKLLQDECSKSDDEDDEDENEDNEDDKAPQQNDNAKKTKARREHLTLPLQNNNGSDPDSLSSSSGVTSPASPTVTDRLVKELVQSLLQRKKGRRLKKLPLAKLHAAALRILQEDMDPYDTGSSAGSEDSNNIYLSPVHKQGSKNTLHHSNVPNTANNTANYPVPPQPVMYGANYYDYCDYYDSWAHAAAYYGPEAYNAFDYNIMPSRAFKLLQEHAQPGGFSPGVINGLWAKCPRIPSSKNVPYTGESSSNKTESCSTPAPVSPPKEPVQGRAT